jgi:transcriptional antiterminator NusG
MSNLPNNEQDQYVPKTVEEAESDPRLCWYVIHTYSGYENKVMDTLQKAVENSEKMQKLILDIRVPVTVVDEIRNGKRTQTTRKVFPGYVMIRMIWTTESWYLVRNTRGVTGFVGPESKPVALSDEEVERMLNPVQESRTNIAIGQEVRVRTGVLEGFEVTVEDMDLPAGKIVAKATMLGREQMIELNIEDVEAVER